MITNPIHSEVDAVDSPRHGLPTEIYKTDFESDSTISQPKMSLNPAATPFSGPTDSQHLASPTVDVPSDVDKSFSTTSQDIQRSSSEPPAVLRRSSRVTQHPDRLNAADLWNPQSRLPPRAYAAFPFPAQPVVPNFPAVLPDLGPDPQTYTEAVSSPDADLWLKAIQQEYDALV